MAKAENLTVEILKQIRDEIVRGNAALGSRIDATNERLDVSNERLGAVEGALLDLAQQHRFAVRGIRALGQRDIRTDARLDALEGRVDSLEKRNG